MNKGERIAKVIARAGLCSRREAEKWIQEGRVVLEGKVLDSPAVQVTAESSILVDGKPLSSPEKTRLWLYFKPRGLVTTRRDEKNRATVFDALPPDLPRVVSVGRLDLNSEGLLLLTNDGALARHLELPATGCVREYRVRVYGKVDLKKIETLSKGITIQGIRYKGLVVTLDRQQGNNAWLTVALTEGKNREIRKIFEWLGWPVNRLIRLKYGPFELGDLAQAQVREVPSKILKTLNFKSRALPTHFKNKPEAGKNRGDNEKRNKRIKRTPGMTPGPKNF